MSRVTEDIYTGSMEQVRMEIDASGHLPKAKLEEGKKYQSLFLKLALEKDNITPIDGMLPSWICFRDFLGVNPLVPIANIMGDYIYKEVFTVEQNITEFILGCDYSTGMDLYKTIKSSPDRVQALANANGIISNKNLLKFKDLVMESDFAEICRIKNINLVDLIESGDVVEILDKAFEFFPSYKSEFIRFRTSVKTSIANTVQTSINGSFRKGYVPRVPEIEKNLFNLNKIVREILKVQFKAEKKIDLDNLQPGMTKKDANKIFDEWSFKKKPMTMMPNTGLGYILYREVILSNEEFIPIPDKSGNSDFKASYIKLSSTKMDKIFAAKNFPKADKFLDYIPLIMDLSVGDNLQQAHQMMSFISTDIEIKEDEIYTKFQKMVPKTVIHKCSEFNIYPINELTEEVNGYIVENKEDLAKVSKEKLDNFKGIEEILGATSYKEIAGLSKEELFGGVAEKIRQQPTNIQNQQWEHQQQNLQQPTQQWGQQMQGQQAPNQHWGQQVSQPPTHPQMNSHDTRQQVPQFQNAEQQQQWGQQAPPTQDFGNAPSETAISGMPDFSKMSNETEFGFAVPDFNNI